MSMDDLLKELQLEYIQSIPTKINELNEFLQKKDLENLINCFHKLKGSGKTYGLEEVSILGQFFELWMREQKEKVLPFVPKSIELLTKIHAARAEGKPFAINADPEYQKLMTIKN